MKGNIKIIMVALLLITLSAMLMIGAMNTLRMTPISVKAMDITDFDLVEDVKGVPRNNGFESDNPVWDGDDSNIMFIDTSDSELLDGENTMMVSAKEQVDMIIAARKSYTYEEADEEFDYNNAIWISMPFKKANNDFYDYAVDINGLLMIKRKIYKITNQFDFSIYREALDTRILYTKNDIDFLTLENNMQKKFDKMTSISEENGKKSITVITKEALTSYWSNPSSLDHELHVGLPSWEILFIIRDSIRIYGEYDEIILTQFEDASLSSWSYAKNIPVIQSDVIYPVRLNANEFDKTYSQISSDIYKLVMYRITALSTRDCFVSYQEAYSYVYEKEYNNNNSLDGQEIFYIPSDTDEFDREGFMKFIVDYNDKSDPTKWINHLQVTSKLEPNTIILKTFSGRSDYLFRSQE